MNNSNTTYRVQAHSLTDKGRRPNNEDFVTSFEPADPQERQNSGCIYIVADGVGGASVGERASQYAAEKVLYEYLQYPEIEPGKRLKQVITRVNREIFDYAEDRGIRMATTLAVAVVLNGSLVVANVGDSRVYLIHGSEVKQITHDHNIVGELVRDGVMLEAEALKSKAKNRLTRSIGGEDEVHVDIFGPILLEPGDKILLCSDGFTRYALREDIASLTTTGSPMEITEKLVALAKKRGRGGADNISVITVAYELSAAWAVTPHPTPKMAKKGATEKAAREKAEREAAEKAAREKANRKASYKPAEEKAEHETAMKSAKEKAEREAAERAAREKAKREAAEKSERELMARESKEKVARERASQAAEKKPEKMRKESRKLKVTDKFKISIAYPKLLSKRFESSFLVHIYLHGERTQVIRNIKSEFQKQKINEQLQSSSIKFGQKIKLKFYSPAFIFPESVTKLIDKPTNKITFLGMPKDNCEPGLHKILISISDANTEQEIDSITISAQVVDFAFDHISRPFLTRFSAIVLGFGSFAMFILTSLEQIDKTVGLTSGTAAGVFAAIVSANFYDLYQRIRPNTP